MENVWVDWKGGLLSARMFCVFVACAGKTHALLRRIVRMIVTVLVLVLVTMGVHCMLFARATTCKARIIVLRFHSDYTISEFCNVLSALFYELPKPEGHHEEKEYDNEEREIDSRQDLSDADEFQAQEFRWVVLNLRQLLVERGAALRGVAHLLTLYEVLALERL